MDSHPGTPRTRLAMRLHVPARRDEHVVPLPASHERHGLTWRALTADDLPVLAALVGRVEASDEAPFRTDVDELAEYFAASSVCDVVGGFGAGGDLYAYGAVRGSAGDGPARVLCSGDVDPSWRDRGIGTALLEWQQHAGTAMVRRLSPSGGVVVVHVDDARAETIDLLGRAGFAVEREFSQMRRDLSAPVPEVALERALALEPWRPDWEESVRRAHNRAFDDSGLAPQYTSEQWLAERTFFVPEWSFVVLDRTTDRARVAGYLMSSRYAQDWPALGWTEGTTDLVGVLPPYRGRHVGSALLCAAMRAYRGDGMEFAGMDVDASDPGGAYDLSIKLGYEAIHRSLAFAKDVPPSA